MSTTRLHNLPVEMTSFVGRAHELSAVSKLLEEHRLVSLVGAGGVGKTRLATQIASSRLEGYPDGAWLIDLSVTADPDVVPDVFAGPFEVGDIATGSDRPMIEVLAEFFADKHLLLLPDNCEHVAEAVQPALSTLLEKCPNIDILTTSREPINLAGEIVYRVAPLRTDSRGETGSEAVDLFLERLELVDASYRPNPTDLEVIRAIVTRLDGLPLAIELAASRAKLLSPAQILDRLSDRFEFLSSEKGVGDRHETLRATISWSYDLLDPPEKQALQRLAVFRGWSLDAAEDVLGASATDRLESLVDKSLVEVTPGQPENRYRMLETVRAYALERLTESGRGDEIREEHAHFFLNLAKESDAGLKGPEQAAWVRRVKPDHDNIRSALGWALASDHGDLALEFVAAMGRYWFVQTHWAEALRWFQRATEAAKDDHPLAWARAFLKTGSIELITQGTPDQPDLVEEACQIALQSGNLSDQAMAKHFRAELHPDQAHVLVDEAIALYRRAGDKWGEYLAKRWLGSKVELLGDPTTNIEYQREAVAGFAQLGDRWSAGWMAFDLGFSLLAVEDYEEARWAFQEALDLVDGLDDRLVRAHATRGLGSVEFGKGNFPRAEATLLQSVPLLEQIGDATCLSFSRMYLADVRSELGDPAETAAFLSWAARGFAEVNHQGGIAAVLRRFAREALRSGDPVLAAQLLGAAVSRQGGEAANLSPRERGDFDITMRLLGEKLDREAIDNLVAAGAEMELEPLWSKAKEAVLSVVPAMPAPDEKHAAGRRLAAILEADLVGFSRLVSADEVGTHDRLLALRRQFLEPLIQEHRGRLVKTMGDGFLCEFRSVVDAVSCAMAWQEGMAARESSRDHNERFRFRIGIGIGDLIIEGEDVFGDGVNVAARLEAMADPGGIYLSGDAYRHVKGKVHAPFEPLGEFQLKNIPDPISVYRVGAPA